MVLGSLRAVRSEKKAVTARGKFSAAVSLGGRSLGRSVNPADLGCFKKRRLLSNTLRICGESPGSASNLPHNSCNQGAETEPSEEKKGRTATRSGLTVLELCLPDRLELSGRHPNFVPRELGPSVVTPHRISRGGDSGNDAANEVVGNRILPDIERY